MNASIPTIIQTTWNPVDRILRTRLSGILQPEQIAKWEQSLEEISYRIPSHLTFSMLVDIQGYEVGDQDPSVHQQQRVVIPTFLAHHGFEVGFFRLFEMQNAIAPNPTLARCHALAYVHHDCDKMALYDQNLGTPTERFFCNLADAEAWLYPSSQRRYDFAKNLNV